MNFIFVGFICVNTSQSLTNGIMPKWLLVKFVGYLPEFHFDKMHKYEINFLQFHLSHICIENMRLTAHFRNLHKVKSSKFLISGFIVVCKAI